MDPLLRQYLAQKMYRVGSDAKNQTLAEIATGGAGKRLNFRMAKPHICKFSTFGTFWTTILPPPTSNNASPNSKRRDARGLPQNPGTTEM